MENIKDDSSDDDIKNLYIYLSGNSYFLEVVKSSSIITSIETFEMFSEEDAKNLKNILVEKSNNGFITFEQFKSIWITKFDSSPSVKDVRKHFVTLIDDILTINGYNPIDKNEFKLDKDILARIILGLEMTSIEEDAILLAEDLVKSIDSDVDGKVSLKDFEFLLEEYLNISDKKNKNF